jgi:hypothetical protein
MRLDRIADTVLVPLPGSPLIVMIISVLIVSWIFSHIGSKVFDQQALQKGWCCEVEVSGQPIYPAPIANNPVLEVCQWPLSALIARSHNPPRIARHKCDDDHEKDGGSSYLTSDPVVS